MAAQTVLEELTKDELTREHVQQRVDDWLKRLESLYAAVESWLPSGWGAKRGPLIAMHEEHLCWGQLETEIDDACRATIRRRKSNASWDVRRGFDFYDPDDKRLSGLQFDRRVAIVLDREGEPGRPYAKVMSYYQMRNKVAHRKLEAKRIDVAQIIADFYFIQGALTR